MKLLERVQADLAAGHTDWAISRLEGYFRHDPVAPEIHDLLAGCYLQQEDRVRAGRHWYFKQPRSAVETACVLAFEQSLGGDPVLIARALLYQENYRLSRLDEPTIAGYRQLLDRIRAQQSIMPRFLRQLEAHIGARARRSAG